MEVIIAESAEAVGRLAGAKVASVLARRPESVVGLATGSSPLSIYAELGRRVADGSLDLTRTHGFALDEYVGLDRNHPESYAAVILREVVHPLGMAPERVHVPDGWADDIESACVRYEEQIAAVGGIDVQILGIGSNGHIGFNEPTSSFASRTRIKTLAPATRADNARFFARPEDVPTHCITQGLGTIREAKEIVLVAQGEQKAAAVARAIEGPVTSMCPASLLQFHPRTTVIVDEAAATQLTMADYFRHVFDNKPEWQTFN